MNNEILKLITPLSEDKIKKLRSGDAVYLSGTIVGARDMAHRRMVKAIKNGEKLPVSLQNETIFYVGPSPAPPDKISGSIGPTTSARMDSLTEPLLKNGLRAMIGKGKRNEDYKKLLIKYRAVYLVAIGGASAFLSTKVKEIKKIAYRDLGAEALYSITVKDFPLFVAYDIYGGDVFKLAEAGSR